MRTSALVRLSALVAAAGVTLAVAVPTAHGLAADPAADTAAPVVTDDAVELWPNGTAIVDVLANDVDPDDPDGSSLALCRLPTIDIKVPSLPPVIVADGPLGSQGDLLVMALRSRLSKPVSIDYYVCNYSRLTPATLTVTMRSTKPVTVRKVKGKAGRLLLTNRNDQSVMFTWEGRRTAGATTVRAHSHRVVKVSATSVRWYAVIGDERNSGIAGEGKITGITLPAGKTPKSDVSRVPAYVRDAIERVR